MWRRALNLESFPTLIIFILLSDTILLSVLEPAFFFVVLLPVLVVHPSMHLYFDVSFSEISTNENIRGGIHSLVVLFNSLHGQRKLDTSWNKYLIYGTATVSYSSKLLFVAFSRTERLGLIFSLLTIWSRISSILIKLRELPEYYKQLQKHFNKSKFISVAD